MFPRTKNVKQIACFINLLAVCTDPMGIESGLITNNMVTVSSSTFENFNALSVSLNSETAWVPFTASANQWIQVNLICAF